MIFSTSRHFANNGLAPLVLLEKKATANQYKVILTDLLYLFIKHFYLDGDSLSRIAMTLIKYGFQSADFGQTTKTQSEGIRVVFHGAFNLKLVLNKSAVYYFFFWQNSNLLSVLTL